MYEYLVCFQVGKFFGEIDPTLMNELTIGAEQNMYSHNGVFKKYEFCPKLNQFSSIQCCAHVRNYLLLLII